MRESPFSQIKPPAFRHHLPNFLTLLSFCAGLMSMKFALDAEWRVAVAAILFAAIIDSLDGALARALRSPSRFGAYLDSLADLVSFGVAPGFLIYSWAMPGSGLGWALVLGYAVGCALRLARFNTLMEDPDRPVWKTKFLIGVPAPMGAMIVMTPLYLSFLSGAGFMRNILVCGPILVIGGMLMISRLPTYSPKRIAFNRDYILPVMAGAAMFVAFIGSYLWGTVSVLVLLYLLSLPLSRNEYRREEARAAARQPDFFESIDTD